MGTSVSAFCRWLAEQRHREDVVGRIAKVVAYRRNFPRHTDRLTLLLKAFESHPEHREMLRHAHAVWRRARGAPSPPRGVVIERSACEETSDV